MLKTLIIIGAVVGILIGPVLGMAITPTRDLILGLAPEEAILKLADAIDINRVDSDSKIQELQSTIDEQQARLAEQQKLIDSQKVAVEKASADVVANTAVVSNETECRKLYSANPECTISNKIYRTKSAFDDFIDGEKERTGQTDKQINSYKKTYATCQDIIAKCD